MLPDAAFIEYVEKVAVILEQKLGDNVLGVYRIGSLAHGGFSIVYSDIDVAVILQKPPPQSKIDEVLQAAKYVDIDKGARLSLFWSNPSFEWGRFPILDQLDLIDHGIRIRGTQPLDFKRPTLDQARAALLDHVRNYWKQKTEFYSGIPKLNNDKDQKEFVRSFLYPARFLYTWNNGTLGSNDEAVEYIKKLKVPGLNLDVICTALNCRYGKSNPTTLLPCQKILHEQYAATFKAIGLSAP